MKVIKKFDRYISILFITTIIVISATSYFAFEKVIRSHIKHQQQATIPLFSLITSEVIRPLTISSFMATDQFLINFAQSPANSNEEVLSQYLEKLSNKYGMLTFVALEKHGYMLDSSNKKLSLDNTQSEWYHRLKILSGNQFADIGNLDDPHLYFDIKLMSDNDDFLGFVGVGIDLNYFATAFKNFDKQFGIELLFTDEEGNIILTSNHLMKTEKHHRSESVINISSLTWYEDFSRFETGQALSNVSVNNGGGDIIISQLPIPEINWHVYILSPPEQQQSQYWQEFVSKLFLIFLVASILYLAFNFILSYFKSNVVKDSETDFLTKLPNRAFVNWRFEQIKKEYHHASVVMADIDHFKIINDDHGHLVGDDVLKIVAKKMAQNIRDIDIAGRWGGEEFVLILPDTSIEQAHTIIDRLRENIQDTVFKSRNDSGTFQVTVSFGITHAKLADINLDSIINQADSALYQAKESGRNKVQLHTPSTTHPT